MTATTYRPARAAVDARLAEARRVLELSARHGVAFEFTADGWRMVDAELVAANLPPAAEDDVVTICESCTRTRSTGTVRVAGRAFAVCDGCRPRRRRAVA